MKILISLSQFNRLHTEMLRDPAGRFNSFVIDQKLWAARPDPTLLKFCADMAAAGHDITIVAADWPVDYGHSLEKWFNQFGMGIAPRGVYKLVLAQNGWQDGYGQKMNFYLSNFDRALPGETMIIENNPAYSDSLAFFVPALKLVPNVYLARNVLGTPQPKAQATA